MVSSSAFFFFGTKSDICLFEDKKFDSDFLGLSLKLLDIIS